MSGNTARRLGVSQDDPDLEDRLLRIEAELDTRALSNSQSSVTAQRRRRRQRPPAVTGLALETKVVGAISVKWNPLTESGFDYYEVEVSTSKTFNPGLDTQAYRVTDTPRHQFEDGDSLTTYYVRVRAVSAQLSGAWSSVLNTTTGQAGPGDLGNNAATLIVEEEELGGADINFTGSPVSEDYGSATITTIGGVVAPRVISEVEITSAGTTGTYATLTVEFIRLTGAVETTVGTYVFDLQSNVSSANLTVGGFAEYDVPTVGVHTYFVRVTVSDGSSAPNTDIEPVRTIIQLIEHRSSSAVL